jgi:hypothetical protein
LLRLKSRGPWRICVQVGGGLLLLMDAEGGWNRGDCRKFKINVGLEIEQPLAAWGCIRTPAGSTPGSGERLGICGNDWWSCVIIWVAWASCGWYGIRHKRERTTINLVRKHRPPPKPD